MFPRKDFLKCGVALAVLCVGTTPLCDAAVTFDAPGHVAVEGSPVSAKGGEPGAKWKLLDWRRRETGVSGAFDRSGKTALPSLPSGYYRLVGAGNPTDAPRPLASLAVVPDPAARPKVSGSFYGADCATSQLAIKREIDCPWNDGDRRRTAADLAHLAGFTHVRDRMGWRAVQPSRDAAPNFSRYIATARLFKERGIGVSGIFHDTPEWADRIEKLPGDLNAVYRFCNDAATAFGDLAEDWEFWNEPDIGFAPEPAWDYAAALKAAYLGAKAARPGSPVLGGALCQMPDSTYERVLFANDAAYYFDVFNYHTYAAPAQYKSMFATMREALRRAGAAGCPVWITECGTNFEGPATDASVRNGNKAHSPEQELVVAEFSAKAQVALQMEGIARNYFFILAAYNERGGSKDWGMLRRDGTAKPVYAALSAMTRELGDARLAGAINVGKELRAYLFEHPGGSQSVAFWSVSPVDTATVGSTVVKATPDYDRTLKLKLPSAGRRFRLADLCGTVSSVAPDAGGTLTLAATRFPAYVSELRGLRADEPARSMGDKKDRPGTPDKDISVVFRVILAPGDFEKTKTIAIAKTDAPRLRVQVWNFGDSAKTGVVESRGARLRGLPVKPIVLGPRGSAPAEFDCVLESSSEAALELSGVFGGRRTTRLSIPLLFEKRFLAECEAVPLGWKDPAAWKRNDSAATYSAKWDEKEQAVRFDVEWTDPSVGRWFYPVLPLSLPRESMKGALRVAFEVKTAQDKIENDFGHRYLMLVRNGKRDSSSDHRPYAAPTGSWERRYVELPPFSVGDLSDVTAIRLGANPNGMRLTFWVRDIQLLKARQPSPAAASKAPLRVALTFDDSLKDDLLVAAPMLEERGWRGTFNIVTDWVGKDPKHLTWDDVRELVRRGHEIASHTKSHKNLVSLQERGRWDEVRHEISESADKILSETGAAPSLLFTPFFKQNDETRRICRELGLRLADVPRYNFGSNNCERVAAVIAELRRSGAECADLLHHGVSQADHGGWCSFANRESFRRHLDAIAELEKKGEIVVVDYDGLVSSRALKSQESPRRGPRTAQPSSAAGARVRGIR